MNELNPRPFLVLPVEDRSVGTPSDRRFVLSGGGGVLTMPGLTPSIPP